eukprot:CAMPEP_0118955394 /NCGR_PEP_ID=MMETSP1169-20130426/59894_1 /TAXON_ID=36882 /ORGANISM="Pyramimonas obovata, Strain CCMP722" /LENGTH=57 /DNA_ID=CAMNT_0006903231 /DNA_START=242 /DNA_END=412 /DNA_ORIENTATION=-
MALYFWPSSVTKCRTASRPLGLLLAGATVVMRPTGAILWVPLVLRELLYGAHRLRFV